MGCYGSIMGSLLSHCGMPCCIMKHYGVLWDITEHYKSVADVMGSLRSHYITEPLCEISILPIRHRMYSSAACTRCTIADEFNYSAAGTLLPHHCSPSTHRSLSIIFTVNLTLTTLTVLIPPPSRLVFYGLECSSPTWQS